MHLARPTLGTAQLRSRYGIGNHRGPPAAEQARRILHTAVELGVRCIDTAPDYGDAEAFLGEWLQQEGRPSGLELCSKLPALPRDLDPGAVRRRVDAAVERSRRALRTDRLDFYLLHRAADLDRYGQVLIESLLDCQARGWLGAIGVSVYEAAEAEAALQSPALSALQFPFHVFDRRLRDRGTLRRAERAGVTTFARSPLLQGMLGMAPEALPPALAHAAPLLSRYRDLADGQGWRPEELAFAYCAQEPLIDRVVFGADDAAQVERALLAMRRPLPVEMRLLIERSLPPAGQAVRDPRQWVVEG